MKSISLCLVLIAATCAPLLTFAAAPPNIVLIIADDISPYDLGAYGNSKVQSPNLDRMAQDGMRFDNAFVTIASCSPSRASIITGKYPHNTDAEQLHWPLTNEHEGFVSRLREAGYWTGAAGKWHLGEEAKERFHEVREADVTGYQIPAGGKGGFEEVMDGDERSGSHDWVPLLQDRPRDQPFFLWLASLDAHRPYSENIIPNPHRPEDVLVPPFMLDIPEVRQDLALYYDEITRFDHYVGRVMKELKTQDVADNTLIIVMSDNGQPFPRAKVTLYDSGIKTPFIAYWPEGIKAGSVSKSLISAVDIAPTVIEITHAPKLPSVEGKSFAQLFKNPQASTRPYAFAEKHWHDYEDQVRAVTSGSFKYIRNYLPNQAGTPSADGVRSPAYAEALKRLQAGTLPAAQQAIFINPRPEEELYDCENDPFETRNLAGNPKYASKLKELRNALSRWQKDTGDVIPSKRTPDEFDRNTGLPTDARIRPRPTKAEMIEMGIVDR